MSAECGLTSTRATTVGTRIGTDPAAPCARHSSEVAPSGFRQPIVFLLVVKIGFKTTAGSGGSNSNDTNALLGTNCTAVIATARDTLSTTVLLGKRLKAYGLPREITT